MATVATVIDQALTYIGVIAAGETPAAEDYTLGLAAVNWMLDSWAAEKIAMLGLKKAAYTLNGAASYTIGPAGTWNVTPRPLKIKSAGVVTAAGLVAPVTWVDAKGWESISDKTRTGLIAEHGYYDQGSPLGTVYLTPKPAAGTLDIISYENIAAYTATGDTVTMPAGFMRPLVLNLAVELCVPYGKEISQSLAALAGQSKQAVKSLYNEILGDDAPQAPQPAQG
jgi:hypothetical protein